MVHSTRLESVHSQGYVGSNPTTSATIEKFRQTRLLPLNGLMRLAKFLRSEHFSFLHPVIPILLYRQKQFHVFLSYLIYTVNIK